MFRQAGVIQVDTLEDMFDVAQLLAHQPLPRGRRVAIVGNSDALGLLAADAASAVGLLVNRSVALGSDATAEDFEDALDEAIDDPDVDSVIAVYIPPLDVTADEVANVLAAVGEQSDKPLVSSFLGAEGIRSCSACRTSPAPRPDAVGAVVPGRRGRGAGAGARRRVRRVVARAGQPAGRPGRGAAGRGAGSSSSGCSSTGRRRWSSTPSSSSSCWRPTASTCGPRPGRLLKRGAAAKRSAGTSSSSPRWSRCASAPTTLHVWRNIDGASEMRDAWGDPQPDGPDPADAAFVVQKTRRPASRLDPFVRGPAVRTGGLVRHLRAGHRAPRRLGLPDPAAASTDVPRWCARSSLPLLFGYRGADPVDIGSIEKVITKVAHLQNDLPEVSALELSLALAGVARGDRADGGRPARSGA